MRTLLQDYLVFLKDGEVEVSPEWWRQKTDLLNCAPHFLTNTAVSCLIADLVHWGACERHEFNGVVIFAGMAGILDGFLRNDIPVPDIAEIKVGDLMYFQGTAAFDEAGDHPTLQRRNSIARALRMEGLELAVTQAGGNRDCAMVPVTERLHNAQQELLAFAKECVVADAAHRESTSSSVEEMSTNFSPEHWRNSFLHNDDVKDGELNTTLQKYVPTLQTLFHTIDYVPREGLDIDLVRYAGDRLGQKQLASKEHVAVLNPKGDLH